MFLHAAARFGAVYYAALVCENEVVLYGAVLLFFNVVLLLA